jgi:hypothetical protein
MSESTIYERYGKPIVKGIVVFLISVSLFGSYSLISAQGVTLGALGAIVVTLYISALVFYGVFWEDMDSRRFRLALYFGVILWGGERFLSGDDSLFSIVLLLGGMGMFIRELYFQK